MRKLLIIQIILFVDLAPLRPLLALNIASSITERNKRHIWSCSKAGWVLSGVQFLSRGHRVLISDLKLGFLVMLNITFEVEVGLVIRTVGLK